MSYFSSHLEMFNRLKDFFPANKHMLFEENLRYGSPYSLLQIYLKDSFYGDFSIKNRTGVIIYTIANTDIKWHLVAIRKALKSGNYNLADHYGHPKFKEGFLISRNEDVHGQGKLLFSSLMFALESYDRGYNVVEEVGGGVDLGGSNHKAVIDVMMAHEKKMDYVFIDVEQSDTFETYKTCLVTYKKKAIERNYVTKNPVFCDIYNDSNWDDLQRNLCSPYKMYKILSADGQSMYTVTQPYHKERRQCLVDKHNIQFLSVLKDVSIVGFDSCSNCMLWKALITTYKLDKSTILRALLKIDVPLCGRYAGQNVFKRICAQTDSMAAQIGDDLGLYPNIEKLNFGASGTMTRRYTSEEHHVVDFLRMNFESVTEVVGNGVLSYAAMDRAFFSGGVHVYRGGTIPIDDDEAAVENYDGVLPACYEEVSSERIGQTNIAIWKRIYDIIPRVNVRLPLPGTYWCIEHGFKKFPRNCDCVGVWCFSNAYLVCRPAVTDTSKEQYSAYFTEKKTEIDWSTLKKRLPVLFKELVETEMARKDVPPEIMEDDEVIELSDEEVLGDIGDEGIW